MAAMKVLYLITRADLGGAQVHLLDLLQGLHGRVQATVAVGEEGFLTDAVRNLGVTCHVVPHLVQPMSPVEDLRALPELVALIRVVRPDLVHSHTSKAGVLGRFAAKIAGVPSVYTAHTWCFAEQTSWKWKVAGIPAERLAARCSSTIINVSEANRTLALRYRIASESQLCTIHNGIIDTSQRAEPGRRGVPTIAVVARFSPQKDQALFIRALSEIDPPARAVFVGDGPTRASLEAEACRLKVRDRVQFLGERRDVAAILASAHVFALPTKWEGFPLSVLEAMRAGLPVVASNVGGVSEALANGVTGFLVPCGNSAAFRSGLSVLIENPARRGQMGEAGRKLYEAEFTLDSMLQKILAVYSDIIYGTSSAKSSATRPAPRPELSAGM
jgi:glycosyltransferase involved in cell wall biosynthesis